MAKRIIYQCDRCSKTIEQQEQPSDWPTIDANYPTPKMGGYARDPESKMFCSLCWATVRQVLPVAKAAPNV